MKSLPLPSSHVLVKGYGNPVVKEASEDDDVILCIECVVEKRATH